MHDDDTSIHGVYCVICLIFRFGFFLRGDAISRLHRLPGKGVVCAGVARVDRPGSIPTHWQGPGYYYGTF